MEPRVSAAAAIDYRAFLAAKAQRGTDGGFEPQTLPEFLYGFQRVLVDWAVRKGRGAVFADCGLGKTPMQLVWADNVVRLTGRRVLIFTPLAVAEQTAREADKFGLECHHSQDGRLRPGINVTNYERLHYFRPQDFAGLVCDESSCLKAFDRKRAAAVTEFARTLPYRSLWTATPAPNDFIELGTSSEVLGEMGRADMLSRFFKRDQEFVRVENMGGQGWRFRGHAEHDFWRWVCSWARAVRRPADLGFDDGAFVLPELLTEEHLVRARFARAGRLFDTPAESLEEQREERRRTLPERCDKVAELLAGTGRPAVAWCHLNDEGDRLERLIPGAVQVSGKDPDERKEEVFRAFATGEIRVLVTKPRIAAFGLNWQHCAHQTFFPSHSFEEFYQAVRRSWRFGQRSPVKVDIVTTEGEGGVLANLQRKAAAAELMFARLVALMNDPLHVERRDPYVQAAEAPPWL